MSEPASDILAAVPGVDCTGFSTYLLIRRFHRQSQQSDLNRRPSDYKSDALPLCYAGEALTLDDRKNFFFLHIIPISYRSISKLFAQVKCKKRKKCLLCLIFMIFPPVNDLLKAAFFVQKYRKNCE